MRRENQPSHAPHKPKEAVDYLLCCDPGDDDDEELEHFRRKISRSIGLNIRLDRFHKYLHSHHPDACRNEVKSLLTMGFTRLAIGTATTSPEVHAPSTAGQDPHIEASRSLGFVPSDAGEDHEVVESGSLTHALSATMLDPHIGASASLEMHPSTAGQFSLAVAYRSLGTTPSRRLRQPS